MFEYVTRQSRTRKSRNNTNTSENREKILRIRDVLPLQRTRLRKYPSSTDSNDNYRDIYVSQKKPPL